MKKPSFFVDTVCKQASCHNNAPCGDSFQQQLFPARGHTVLALSDGMGHGIKANLLSSLTCSIFMGMAGAEESIEEVAQTVMQTLPVCSVRKTSYSTFTLAAIDNRSGEVRLVEYDNPQIFVFRGTQSLVLEREAIAYVEPQTGRTQTLYSSRFTIERGDRIVITTDGVTQSGIGTDRYPFGWSRDNVQTFLDEILHSEPYISADALASKVLNQAVENDAGIPKDDISCAVIHIREPKQLLLCSCPPSLSSDVGRLADRIRNFGGTKIVCGRVLAGLIADYWQTNLRRQLTSTDPELPPEWEIAGLDIVTEGVLTLSKVLEILQNYEMMPTGRGPAYHICKMLLSADQIELIVGMRKSNASTADAETLILRRRTLRAIAQLLESRFTKQITITYL